MNNRHHSLAQLAERKEHRKIAQNVVRFGGTPHPFHEWQRRCALSLRDAIQNRQIAARNAERAQAQGEQA
jgi:hypothetical protein